MTPVQDIYMLPKTKPQHTHSPASTVCHVALFHAVLVWLRECFCVKSQTIAGGSKQDWPERKIPPPVKWGETTQRFLAHPLCTFASQTPASQTRIRFLNTEDITYCPPATSCPPSFCSIFKSRLRADSKCHEPPQPPVWSKTGLVRAADSMLAHLKGWVRWLLGFTRCCLNIT